MKAGRIASFSPLALTALVALTLISLFEFLDGLIWPDIAPVWQRIHVGIFTSFICCIAAFFISRNLKTSSLMASIVESTEDGIIAKDLDGKIISWNMGAQQIYGYSFDEVKGKPTSILLASDVEDETPKILDRIREGKRVEHIEAYHVRKDGKPVHVFLTVSPIRNATGTITGASTIVRDITERKRIEAALMESEERMRFALESAQIGTFDYKPGTGEVFFNEQSRRLRGLLTGEQLNYAEAIERIHPEDRERVEREVKSALEPDAGGLFQSEYRIVWADNSIHWIVSKGRVQFEGSGAQPYAVRMAGISLDTTERKRMEEELQRAKASLEEEVKRQTADLVLANEQLTREIEERKHSEETLRQSEIRYKKLSQEFDALLECHQRYPGTALPGDEGAVDQQWHRLSCGCAAG